MEASKSSFSTTLLIFQDENDLDALLQRFYSRELDGFVSANFPLWDSWNKAFKKNKIPVAIIGGNPKEDLPTLNINDFEMSFAMTERAIRSGRNKMAFLAGYETSHTGNERKHGFLKALKKNGLSHCGVHSCDFNEELAYKNTLRIIKDENLHFDSLICANDSMAVGAAKALLEKDYKIPEDVLVTGADGTDLLKYFTPHLPTYSMLPEKRGEESFKLLKAQFDGELKNKHIVIESKLETWGVI
jgi:LacI family transcriptional regulator